MSQLLKMTNNYPVLFAMFDIFFDYAMHDVKIVLTAC